MNNPGKHMICDISHIEDVKNLNSITYIQQILDIICDYNKLDTINRMTYEIPSSGYAIHYMLSESYISIHSFPQNKYLAFDFYTSRNYEDNEPLVLIYDFLLLAFQANETLSTIQITDRKF
jgi:S-adenosylmethionine decarboxylase